MFRIVFNIPRVEDGYYLDKKITAAPYNSFDEAFKVFDEYASTFLEKFYKSDKTITKDHWNDGTTEFYYCYTDPYDCEQKYYLGGVEVIDEEDYFLYES